MSHIAAASAAITKSSHLMALHIVVSSCLLLALPVVVCSILGIHVSDSVAALAQHTVTAICTAGGVVIGASATRHSGEGYAKAKAGQTAPVKEP